MSVRVLVVDDSEVCRAALRDMLEADGDITVVGDAETGARERELVSDLRPDLVTTGLAVPGERGLALVEWIMARHPVPVLVVTGQRASDTGPDLVFEAIRRGALDLVAKPDGTNEAAAAKLRTVARELARVPVVRHVDPTAGPWRPERALPLAPPRPTSGATTDRLPAGGRVTRAIGLCASAGGPSALVAVIRDLPATLPAAIAVVQHLPVGFTEGFAELLRSATGRPVVVVHEAAPVERGTIYLASDGAHLVAIAGGFVARPGPPVDGHCPSATVLLRSLAEVYGPRAAAGILTGIGNDGAEGLREMREAGGFTVAQDRESSAVYGMPRAAVLADAAVQVLPLREIAATLQRAVHA